MGQNIPTQNLMKFKVNETLESLKNLLQHITSPYNKDIFTYLSIPSTNV